MNIEVATIVAFFIALARCAETQTQEEINGRFAKPGEFPFHVSLEVYYRSPSLIWNFCGGSILNKEWIVTSAQCIDFIEEKEDHTFIVKAGKTNLKESDCFEQKSFIESYYLHGYYNSSIFPRSYDIALLKLKIPFIFNNRVQPIALPTNDYITNDVATISGWDWISRENNDKDRDILQTMNVTISDPESCNDEIEYMYKYKNMNVTDAVPKTGICTKQIVSGISTCVGHPGGPLTLKKGNSSELIGIMSWGLDICGYKGYSTVFTHVFIFKDWIKSTIYYVMNPDKA